MKYQELWMEENTRIQERYDLAMERISEIIREEGRIAEPFRSYFVRMARFMEMIEELARMQLREELDGLSLEELAGWNHTLYKDILPENYGESYANPDYAVRVLGEGLGPLLSSFYVQLRGYNIIYN